MFNRKPKKKNEHIVQNAVEIKDMSDLHWRFQAVAKTFQSDFGAPWSFETEEYDDEAAFAVAYALAQEIGFNIFSQNEEVNEFLRNIEKYRVNGKYKNFLMK